MTEPNGWRYPYRAISLALLLVLVTIVLSDRVSLHVTMAKLHAAAAQALLDHGDLNKRLAAVEGAIRLHSAIAATPDERKVRVLDLALRALDPKVREAFEERLGTEWLRRKMQDAGLPPIEIPGQRGRTRVYPRGEWERDQSPSP